MTRRLATLAGTVAALAAFTTPSAQAASAIKATPSQCTALTGGTQVFLRLLDFRNYVLAPGGDFENDAKGWTLLGGAKVVTGGNRAIGGTKALALPNGGSALSPVFCADSSNPTFRMYSSNASWLPGRVHAELVWIDTDLKVHSTPVGADFSFPLWKATGSMLLASVLPLPDGYATPVQLRFKGVLGGALLDDVYIDPARGR